MFVGRYLEVVWQVLLSPLEPKRVVNSKMIEERASLISDLARSQFNSELSYLLHDFKCVPCPLRT